MKYFSFFIALFICINCSLDDQKKESPQVRFAIYLLADTTLVTDQVRSEPLHDLELTSTPLITVSDIHTFHWQTQEFIIYPAATNRVIELRANRQTSFGIPIVFVAEGERIYLGAFWYAFSSLAPPVPYIELLLIEPRLGMTELIIEKSWLPGADDPRFDTRIYEALKNAGILID